MIMEMLNNILFAENARLVSIITSPLIFVEVYLSFCLFTSLLNIEYSKKQAFLYVFSSSVCSIITSFFVPNQFNVIFNYVFIFTIICLIFKQNILKSIAMLVFPVFIFALTNLLIVKLYMKVLDITYAQVSSVLIYRLFYLIIVYFVVFHIVIILKRKNTKVTILDTFDKTAKLMLIMNFVCGMLAISIQSILIAYYINIAPTYISFLSFAVLIFYFIINLYSLSRITQLTVTTRDL